MTDNRSFSIFQERIPTASMEVATKKNTMEPAEDISDQ